MSVEERNWPDGTPSNGTLYELRNGDITAVLTPIGASLVQLEVPGRSERHQVVLGFDGPDGYRDNPSNFGSVVGPYANRIGGAAFALGGRTHRLEANNGPNCLHSGSANFARHVWTADPATIDGDPAIQMSTVSPDGDGGFPGRLQVRVTYRLTQDSLDLEYEAETDAETVVSLTNHTYWNLAGADAGDARPHRARINATRRLEVDANVLPTGALLDVAGTPFDFRSETPIDARWPDLTSAGLSGYDHCFALDSPGKNTVAAELSSGQSGVRMTVRTTFPGCQLYTAAHLDGSAANAGYRSYAGVCLECQQFPDSPNQPTFPRTVLVPGETLRESTHHQFSVD